MTKAQAVEFLTRRPYLFGHAVGFTRLGEIQNGWIVEMISATEDRTLQAHRGSYKTTCVSVALALLMILRPTKKILFVRKTGADVTEIVGQVRKILTHPATDYFVRVLYGAPLVLKRDNASEIDTCLDTDPRGTPQLVALGIGTSITGKHFDYIFTDDIVNLSDRYSRAERENTKAKYQELLNLITRPGRIYNTGTPWHPDDAFAIMPRAERFDVYATGMLSAAQIDVLRKSMTPSLFSANYELRHIPSDAALFTAPKLGEPAALAEQGIAQVDCAYGGEDFTALTICAKRDGEYYVFGRLWRKHADDVREEIAAEWRRFCAGNLFNETNADKGYFANSLRKLGVRVVTYAEHENKHIKIASYLKGVWEHVHFVVGTDEAYIRQITDYTEDAEHDDAPDSLASAIRVLEKRRERGSAYQSIL